MSEEDREAPEPMGRVMKRVFRGPDGQRVLEWLKSVSQPMLRMPQKTGTELGYYQGRFSLYMNIVDEMEKEDGRAKPVVAPTE